MLYVIKKDGTREEFNPQKIVAAVNKSAERILYTFSDEEKDFIFVIQSAFHNNVSVTPVCSVSKKTLKLSGLVRQANRAYW